jgi:hypothetical protein
MLQLKNIKKIDRWDNSIGPGMTSKGQGWATPPHGRIDLLTMLRRWSDYSD